MDKGSKYRANVAGLLQRPDDGKIFIAERIDVGGAWQFPQGGVDDGEDLETAFYREMEEEIGLRTSDYQVVAQRGGYRYRFPKKHRKRLQFEGQEQTYFLCVFTGDEDSIWLDQHHQEFARYRWIAPEEFDLDWLPKFKREVYAGVLRDFFGVG